MKNIRISVLVPIYKVEKYIGRCIESLMLQSYPNIEYIFIDDCGGDRSLEILKEIIQRYPNRKADIIILQNSINMGIAKCRKILIDQSNGDYVYFVDADDWIEHNSIELLVDNLQDGSVDIVSGNIRDIYKTYTKNRKLLEYNSPRIAMLEIMKRQGQWNVWNRLIKKSLIDKISIPDINNGEDFIMMSQLYNLSTKIVFIDAHTYNYNHVNISAFQNRSKEISNIKDRKDAIYYLKDIFVEDSEIQNALNQGLVSVNALTIIGNTRYKEIRKYRIDPGILSLINKYPIKRLFKLILYLQNFKLYPLIWIINNGGNIYMKRKYN